MPRDLHLRRWLIVLGLAGAVGGFFVYRGLRPIAVTVEPVTRGRAVEAVYATGTVEPIQKVVVKARIGEHVELIAASEGDTVTKGQLLAKIQDPVRQFALSQSETQLGKARQQASGRSPQLASLDAQARALRAQLALATLDLARTEKLLRSAAVTQQEVDVARARAAQLEAQADAADEQLRSSRLELTATRDQLASQVLSLATEVDERVVVSPLAGMVLRRDVEPGEVVAQNQALFEVADVSTLLIELHVDEADIARVQDGAAPSAVALSFYAFPGQAFAGTVAQILPEPDRIRRSYTVKVRLDQPIAGLRVGMTAEANIIVQRKDAVLLVPAEALDGDQAWFVEDGRAVKRPVKLGIRDLTHAELLSGAAEGAQAIVDAARAKLAVGDRVSPTARTSP
jgi:multidrug efflux pump subunit AcrA (membrane-fusion protein)